MTALALALTLAGTGWAQYVNDGATQNASGGWDIHYGSCQQDPSREMRYDCRSYILSAGNGTEIGNTYYNAAFDTQAECIAALATPQGPAEWTNSTNCTNYWYNSAPSGSGWTNQQYCETYGTGHGPVGKYLTGVCRGKWDWTGGDAAFNNPAIRENCTRCHNQKYMSGGAAGVGETYVMTGHKNMAKPLVPGSYSGLYYDSTYHWANNEGNEYTSIDWTSFPYKAVADGKQVYWLYDWINLEPRLLEQGQTYGCARCHMTGYSADAALDTAKEPYKTFGDYTVGPLFSTAADGQPYTSWDQWGIQCSRCHGTRVGGPSTHTTYWAVGKEVTTTGANGATRTNLCMDCHRQEASGAPYDGGTDPAGLLKVGSSHGSLAFFGQFVGHTQGNLYLNSPHGKFSGTSAEIGDVSKYASHFMSEPEGGGCTQCHNVHKSTIKAANPDGGAVAECFECHAKDLNTMRHPATAGTPLEHMGTDPMEACETCHMPNALHLFRVNVDPDYETVPIVSIVTGGGDPQNANTAPDGTFTKAVWNDLDMACGQCHGGGIEQVDTAGVTSSGSKDVVVTAADGFAVGQRVRVVGGGSSGADLDTFVKAVDLGTKTITLYSSAGATLPNAEVIQNPTKNGANYISKARLAPLAKGIHGDAVEANFSIVLGNPNTLQVFVNASASVCGDTCDRYDWDWGDGNTTPVFGNPASSHTYATAGKKIITLTVTDYGFEPGVKSKPINVYTPDGPPVINSNPCSFDADTWTMTVTDTATDDVGIKQEVVNWGDGSLVSNDITAPFGPFNHTYNKAGNFTVTLMVVDTIGQGANYNCLANANYFSISGKVFKSDTTSPVYSAKVQAFKDGVTLAKTAYTATNGTYSLGTLKPGSYTLIVTKTGYVFPAVAPIVVGPSNSTADVIATTP